MKITRKQLKRLILKEFDMSGMVNNDIDQLIGNVGNLPPVEPPRHTPGGGRGPRKNQCEPGMPRFEASFDKVINTFQPWMQDNFFQGGDSDFVDLYLKHLESLNIAVDYDDPFEYLKGLMDVIATYYCFSRSLTNPPNLYSIYFNPNQAIEHYWREE